MGSTCETEVKIALGPTKLPDLDLRDPRYSIHQRSDFREFKVEFCLLHCRPGRFDSGLGTEFGLILIVQLTLGDGLGLGERCVAVHVKSAFAELRLRLCPVALRPVEGRLEGPRIDFEQYLAFADERTFCVVLLDYVTGDLGPDLERSRIRPASPPIRRTPEHLAGLRRQLSPLELAASPACGRCLGRKPWP